MSKASHNILGMSFDHIIKTACTQTITILYKYFDIWELDFRLNNNNDKYQYKCQWWKMNINKN